MNSFLKKLWRDDAGSIVSAELVLVSSLMVAGLVTSLKGMRDIVAGEMADVSAAIGNLDQSYSYDGTQAGRTFTAGASYRDEREREQPQCTVVLSGQWPVGSFQKP